MKQNTHVKKRTSEVKIEFIQLSIKKKVYCQGSATLKINRPMPRCSCSLILHRDAAWRRIVLTLGRRMQGAASLQHLRPPSSAFARLERTCGMAASWRDRWEAGWGGLRMECLASFRQFWYCGVLTHHAGLLKWQLQPQDSALHGDAQQASENVKQEIKKRKEKRMRI